MTNSEHYLDLVEGPQIRILFLRSKGSTEDMYLSFLMRPEVSLSTFIRLRKLLRRLRTQGYLLLETQTVEAQSSTESLEKTRRGTKLRYRLMTVLILRASGFRKTLSHF